MRGFLVAFGAIYLVILVLFRLFEHRLIFFPDYPGRLSGDSQPNGLPVQDVWLEAADGVKLPAGGTPARTLISLSLPSTAMRPTWRPAQRCIASFIDSRPMSSRWNIGVTATAKVRPARQVFTSTRRQPTTT